jgi:hypothetical protein
MLPMTLVLVSLLIPYVRGPAPRSDHRSVLLLTDIPPWNGETLELDFFFPYNTPVNPQFHLDFRDPGAPGGGDVVDLFFARETPMPSGMDRMPDAKLLLPANDWTVESREFFHIWSLGIDAERAIVSREAGSEFAYVIAWRIRDGGLIRESLRSLFGLYFCGDSKLNCIRTVVRIAVPLFHNDDTGRRRARETAGRFLKDFKNFFYLYALASR